MTTKQEHEERLRIALSEVEQELDWFDTDEAFVKLAEFSAELWRVLKKGNPQ